MKIRRVLLFLLVSITFSTYAQNQPTYEYLSMTQVDREIKLAKNSESFETINVRDEMSRDSYDYRPLLKRIQEYEKEGWEIVTNNVYSSGTEFSRPRNYVLMRREKKSKNNYTK